MVLEYVHINTSYAHLQSCTVHIKITIFTSLRTVKLIFMKFHTEQFYE